MRMILQAFLPVETFNAAVKNGSVGAKIQRILEHTKPEAVYFTDYHGQRSALLVVDVKEASQIPAFAEPWFLLFDAKIELHPVMTPHDLGGRGAGCARQRVDLGIRRPGMYAGGGKIKVDKPCRLLLHCSSYESRTVTRRI